jgi:hypothetical protein
VYPVKYEDFVQSPQHSLQQILDFMNYPTDQALIKTAVEKVSDKSIGKGRSQLSNSEALLLEALVSEPLKMYGYL